MIYESLCQDKARLCFQIPGGRSSQLASTVIYVLLYPISTIPKPYIKDKRFRRTIRDQVSPDSYRKKSKKRGSFFQESLPSIRFWDHMRKTFKFHYPPKAVPHMRDWSSNLSRIFAAKA